MNSIAIWYEGLDKGNITIPELDIHINHWKLPKKPDSANDYFLDIGLFIRDGSNISNVCIYIPDSTFTKSKDIEDIGSKLGDSAILTAVFNEYYSVTQENNSKELTIQDKNGIQFKVYKLDVAEDLTNEIKFGGTILKFKFHHFPNIPTYYRFRLKSNFIKNLSFTYRPANFLFESVSSSIEIIDFRINEARSLGPSLSEYIKNAGKFNISLIHYFVMRDVRDEYILSNQDPNSIRQLEEATWASYINQAEYTYKRSFAYHLKQKASEDTNGKHYLNDFTAVLKFRFEDQRIGQYIFWFIVIAFAIELAANWLYDKIR